MLTLVEKPEHANTPFASMGIYLFEYRRAAGRCCAAPPVDLVMDVVRPLLEAGSACYAHEFSGYWEDVGTVRLVLPREPRAARRRSRGSLLDDPRWPILTRDEERPPVA